ncbi:MAG: flagellar hook-basal body complex protein FliE [Pseudohongiellaceae bacterium]|jgi:flagellar hook-basal body complex protein FliE
MNTISDRADISRILMQVRDMQAQMEDGALKGVQNDIVLKDVSGSASIKSDSTGFGSMLKQAVNAVNDTQSKSGALQTAYEMGDPNVDLTEVMIQMQKATVSFEAMTQVRNKMITAYQEVMNMQV